MAIALAVDGDIAKDGGSSTGTSKTFAFDTGTGSDRFLAVGVVGDITNDNVTGVTYAGVAMTRADGVLIPSNRYITFWYLANPASGSNNVIISASASILIGSGVVAYTGASATQTLGTDVQHATGTVTAGTVDDTTVTTTVDNSWTVGWGVGSSLLTSAGTNMTSRVEDDATYGWTLGDNNAAITPAGARAIGITHASGNSAIIEISFSPVGAAPAGVTRRQRTLVGAGQ